VAIMIHFSETQPPQPPKWSILRDVCRFSRYITTQCRKNDESVGLLYRPSAFRGWQRRNEMAPLVRRKRGV